MPIQQHEPLESGPGLMSEAKRQWWAAPRSGGPFKQPRLAVFQHAMNTTPRPTAPSESIAHGYVNNNKFHDREPGLVRKAMEAIESSFFDTFPRKDSEEPMADQTKDAAVGEAARAFYRHGLAAYGKPGKRRPGNQPLTAL